MQTLIIPILGLHTTLGQTLKMGAVFTIVRLARSFALRWLLRSCSGARGRLVGHDLLPNLPGDFVKRCHQPIALRE
ncbi:hypothetical protein D3C81_2222650 [compost metagenome]